MLLSWDESLSLGIPQIDAQNRELIRRMRELGEQLARPVAPAALLAAVQELLSHVHEHFAAEEAWMRARGYPRVSSHSASHHMARELLERALRRCDGPGATERVQALLQRMISWYQIHLRSEDLRLGRFAQGEPVTLTPLPIHAP